jgi:DNA replication protein DnaC
MLCCLTKSGVYGEVPLGDPAESTSTVTPYIVHSQYRLTSERPTRTKPLARRTLRVSSGIDVLVIDDWAMAPLSEPERRDFWEICEDRYQVRSTILNSQLPVSRCHEQIGDPTLADGILDRLVHNAHRIEMSGDSMRKNRGKSNA